MINADDFERQFTQLTGHAPFRWQCRLFAEWFSQGRLPPACAVPTGLGKTSIMALWLIARARGADLPRRLVYVVDRRAVVDQATRSADQLQANAPDALDLMDLRVSTLRGQFVDNRRWLADPSGLAIIVGTIDMIGSRLLFSGYGVSRGMRPFHAGLLGADTLVLLDEAHLCPPFEALLRALANDRELGPRDEGDRAIVPGLQVMPLSATGRQAAEEPFVLRDDDVDPARDRVAYQRFTAGKSLRLTELAGGVKLEDALAERAWQCAVEKGPARVLVYCDRRESALAVKKSLDKRIKGELGRTSGLSELLVGARRVHERQALEEWLENHGFLADSTDPPEHPTFLVATSAGEVGVDLDADHLVCDLVPWERMVQRLGRVNRRGGEGRTAWVDVVAVEPAGKNKKEESAQARDRACRMVLEHLPETDDGRRDASPAAIQHLRTHAESDPEFAELLRRARTEEPLRPALTRPLVEAWSMTSLDQHGGRPEVDPWLRGWADDDPPQTTVAWRRSLPWREGDEQPNHKEVQRYFSLAPVHLEETLEAPAHHVFDALAARVQSIAKSERGQEAAVSAMPSQWQVALILDRSGRCEGAISADQLLFRLDSKDKKAAIERLVGRTVVVASSIGGLENGMLDSDGERVSTLDGASGDAWTEEVRTRLGYLPVGPGQVEPNARNWKLTGSIALTHPEADEAGATRAIRVYVVRGKGASPAGNSAVASRPQLLNDHHAWTREVADRLAEGLGLPAPYKEMLAAVAGCHDAGKDRLLWQLAMNAPADGVYAKTAGGGDGRRLNGYRHEFGTLRDVLHDDTFAVLDDKTRELALHLIAAHHGYAHPVIPPFDPVAPPAEREALAQEAALRFARLQRQWGPWGLAWWESLLRGADQRASKLLDEKGAD